MSDSAVYRPHREAPARARLRPAQAQGAFAGISTRRFEVVSRGDFVPGVLYLPSDLPAEAPGATTPGGWPLLLLAHGRGGSMHAPYLECAARWVREGLAVAAIDLPLHGSRTSPKLSERLVEGLGQLPTGAPLDAEGYALVEEFARQATSDWIRTLDALSALPEVDADRIGFLGFSLGSIVGSYVLAHDTRIRAAALALIGGGAGPETLDPANWVARARGVTTLVVASEQDEIFPAPARRAFFDAVPEPRREASFPGDHGNLPGEAMKEIWSFLRKELGL